MGQARQAIELHDSDVEAVRVDGSVVVLEVRVYIHESEGEPGHDAGVGLSQRAELRVTGGTIEASVEGGRLEIYDGSLELGDVVRDNLLPLPCNFDGRVVLTLEGAEGVIRVRGTGLAVVLKGKPTFIESCP